MLRIDSYDERLAIALKRRVERARERLASLAHSTDKSRILTLLDNKRQSLMYLDEKSRFLANGVLNKAREVLSKNAARVDALSPLSTLSRGYSIAEKNGKTVKSVNELKVGDTVSLRVFDGNARLNVMEIRKEKDNCD